MFSGKDKDQKADAPKPADQPAVKSGPKKEGHDPSPVPTPEAKRMDDDAESPVFDAKAVKDPPAAGQNTPPADKKAKVVKKADEPGGKVFKFQVRNAFVNVDASIRAAGAEEAEEQIREWLCAGLVVKES